MKLISIIVMSAAPTLPEPILLCHQHQLSSFPFFQRKSVQEMSIFLARSASKKAAVGQRNSLDHEGHSAHYYLKGNGLAGFVVTDQEYPDKRAHALVQAVLNKFEEAVTDWKTQTSDRNYDVPFINDSIQKYQDPNENDKIGLTLKEIDAVKNIMHKNIEQTLGRGDEIDNLVQKSADLSARSKQFYKQTKALPKSCCSLQ